MMNLMFALGGLVSVAGAPPSDAAPASAKFAVHAQHVRTVGNATLSDAVLVVENGKLVRLETAADAGRLDMPVIEHAGWLSAGLVACRSYSGARGETNEPKRSSTPDARIADTLDLSHRDFERALHAGITTVVVAPAPSTLVGGTSAAVKTHGGRFASREAQLALSFSQQALRYNRYPTGYASASAELDRQLNTGEGPWGRVAKGELPVLFDAHTRDEIQRAVAFATRHKLRGALSRAWLAGELADEVKLSGLAVIVGPFDVGTEQRALDAVVALAAQRVPLAFAVDAPLSSDDSLRWSAALCVRAGLDRAVAWDALTSTAASIAGVGATLGKLSRGYDADFVLWSGDPLDLTSRVVAVYVDGVQAWGGAQ